MRMPSVLLIALALVGTFRTPFAPPVISTTTESTIVLQTAGPPFLQTVMKTKGDLKGETKESIQ